MNADRFDALSRALAIITRRGTLRLLASAALGLLSREEAGATHTGCRHHGSRCKRHTQCCSGKCSRRRHRCTCPRGTTKCGETACCRNADQQCCIDTCAPATLVPEEGTCASGTDGECCTGLVCTPGDTKCCRPENTCGRHCCLNGTRCTSEVICCASGTSCNRVCCPRASDICTIGDLECCPRDRVCHRSCCARDEFCQDEVECRPIVVGP